MTGHVYELEMKEERKRSKMISIQGLLTTTELSKIDFSQCI